jgi:acetylcholinesterase
MHMLTNGGDTEGLFRGAFMQAGGPSNLGDITRSQPVYDMLVQETGCSGSNDTLDCLRNVPANTLQIAMDKSPSILWAQVCLNSFPKRSSQMLIIVSYSQSI